MRIYLKLTKNSKTIPYSYQHLLTGAIHKWIGKGNAEHGNVSLYSFSWFQKTKTNNNGIELTSDSYFFISSFDGDLLRTIIKGILEDPVVCCGAKVYDIMIKETPEFGNKERFLLASPVFIKRRTEDGEKHIVFNDEQSGKYMFETMSKKLTLAGLSSNGLSIRFDNSYFDPRTKLIDYKGVKNRVNVCPVVIEGTPEQIAFAWEVGVGNSTGIGFGALK